MVARKNVAAKVEVAAVNAIPNTLKLDGITYKFAALDDKSADLKITSIRKAGIKLRTSIHETAIGLVLHMNEHGRHTKFIALADVIGDSLGLNQRKAFVEWVLAFTWLTFDIETKSFSKDKTKENKIVDAMNTPFWTMEKKPLEEPFDFQKAVDQLLKRAEKAIKDDKFKGDAMMVDALKNLRPTPKAVEETVELHKGSKEEVAA